ncbi:MAG: ABC transporter permease [Sutterella sp.]
MQSIISFLFRIRALIRKEFITVLQDPGSRKILIVPVLVQSVLFGYGATFNLERVPWVLLDESRSAQSAEFVRAVSENGIFELVAAETGLAGYTERIDRGEALIGIHIPADFARQQETGTGIVMVTADARNTTTANVAVGYVSVITASLNERRGVLGSIRMVERFRYNENTITRWNIMPGLMLGLSMIQVLMLAGLSVSREREDGSFDMMLMTPATPVEILIGKAIPPILIGIMQAFIIFSVCRFWFEIPFAGSIGTLLLIVTLFASSCVGLGLAISALCRTVQQSMVFAFLILLPSVILSGLMTPVAAMPEWMQTLTILNPLRYAIEALRRVYFEGAGIADVWRLFWPTALLAGVTMPWAVWLFRRKVS